MNTRSDYDPMVVVAANRDMVVLHDGRLGNLLYWDTKSDKAIIYYGGRHVTITKGDVLSVVNPVQ